MTATDTASLTGLLIFSVIWLLVGVGSYVWYAWALSRLFDRIGTDGWRGWVPVLNEMTILERGGVPAWNVVFYFLPIVNLYGLYLKYTATARIGERLGRGPGFAVLGALFTPLWATMLVLQRPSGPVAAQHQEPPAMGHRHMASAPGAHPAPTVPQPGQPRPAMPPGPYADLPAPPLPGAPNPSAPNPSAPQAGAPQAGAPQAGAPQAGAPLPGAPQATRHMPTPAAQGRPPAPTAPLVPASTSPAEPGPATPSAATPADVAPPTPHAPMPEPAPPESPPSSPGTDSGPILVHNPWAQPSTPASVAEEPVTAPSPAATEVPSWLDSPSSAWAAAAQPAQLDADDEDDDDGATVVVDRRPQVQWHLNVDGNAPLPLVGDKVLLGRRPSATAPGIHPLAVPDTTRTLSKAHAHLELVDGEWAITDLNSTNGVLIVDDAGEETLITPGEPVRVTGRFVLGKVGMSISFEQAGT